MIVGVGQFLNRIESLEQAVEPPRDDDACRTPCRGWTPELADLLDQTQSVRVVRGMWSYENPAAVIAERVGAIGAQTVGTLIGGNQNQALLSATALEILAGKFDLVLITGAENGNSSGKARRAGVTLPQTPAPGKPDAVFGAEQQPGAPRIRARQGHQPRHPGVPDVRQRAALRAWRDLGRAHYAGFVAMGAVQRRGPSRTPMPGCART